MHLCGLRARGLRRYSGEVVERSLRQYRILLGAGGQVHGVRGLRGSAEGVYKDQN